jgi:hypothetical protein
LINIFYKNKESKLGFEDYAVVLNDFLYRYGGSTSYLWSRPAKYCSKLGALKTLVANLLRKVNISFTIRHLHLDVISMNSTTVVKRKKEQRNKVTI